MARAVRSGVLMSTRSLTRFYDEQGKEFACMYRHCDGYPEGHGADLADLSLDSGKPIPVTNGISGAGKCFNGPHCLAASVVAGLKDGPGQIYLYQVGQHDIGEEYVYHVRVKDGFPQVEIREVTDSEGMKSKRLFIGGAVELAAFCAAKVSA